MNMAKRTNLFQKLMDETIELPGAPFLVVTRGWYYQHLKHRGCDESERGIGSMDYMVFATPKTSRELTPLAELDRQLAKMPEV